MAESPLRKLGDLGQSLWLDYIRRAMIENGELERLIQEGGLKGVTSNPAIFEDAINRHSDYDDAISRLASTGHDIAELYDALIFHDISAAADVLRPVYMATGGADGFVSIEVSPHLARDTAATITEAHRIWTKIDRPNILIKVPGTREGIDAIRQLIASGININATLLFGLRRYEAIARAYLEGLESRLASGLRIDGIVSVASFFLSRIDTHVDRKLGVLGTPEAVALMGHAAIASAKLAYQLYQELKTSARWQTLERLGGRPQRLLWARTGTKDSSYRDIKYVEALIGPETITTLPMATLNAFRDHGRAALGLPEEIDQAKDVRHRLMGLGIDLDQAAAELEEEGIDKFIESYDTLLKALKRKREAARDIS